MSPSMRPRHLSKSPFVFLLIHLSVTYLLTIGVRVVEKLGLGIQDSIRKEFGTLGGKDSGGHCLDSSRRSSPLSQKSSTTHPFVALN